MVFLIANLFLNFALLNMLGALISICIGLAVVLGALFTKEK